jgi:hypothetical protein
VEERAAGSPALPASGVASPTRPGASSAAPNTRDHHRPTRWRHAGDPRLFGAAPPVQRRRRGPPRRPPPRRRSRHSRQPLPLHPPPRKNGGHRRSAPRRARRRAAGRPLRLRARRGSPPRESADRPGCPKRGHRPCPCCPRSASAGPSVRPGRSWWPPASPSSTLRRLRRSSDPWDPPPAPPLSRSHRLHLRSDRRSSSALVPAHRSGRSGATLRGRSLQYHQRENCGPRCVLPTLPAGEPAAPAPLAVRGMMSRIPVAS